MSVELRLFSIPTFAFAGRTHRSNQVSAPEYLFLISELAGEKRFASTVAKRLECLGALTHGDRRASNSRDLSQFNLENKYGREALQIMLRALANPRSEPFLPAPSTYQVGKEHFFTDVSLDANFANFTIGNRHFLSYDACRCDNIWSVLVC